MSRTSPSAVSQRLKDRLSMDEDSRVWQESAYAAIEWQFRGRSNEVRHDYHENTEAFADLVQTFARAEERRNRTL